MSDAELAVPEPTQGEMFVASEDKPIVLRDEMEALGLLAPHIQAKELIGQTFIIFKAKTFPGMGDPNRPPYFCHCTDLKKEEVWTVVLGGQAVTEVLTGYIATGLNKPIQVTLGWVEGGAYGGYFVFE